MRHLVGYAQKGTAIYVDLINSAAAKHIASEPHLLGLAAEALKNLTLKKPFISIEYDMGRDIGYDFIVETTAADNIFYAQLVRETSYTRFTKNRKARPARSLVLILHQDHDTDVYDLQDIWIGHHIPPTPGNDQTAESKAYWESHAVIFDKQPLQSRTITKVCPY